MPELPVTAKEFRLLQWQVKQLEVQLDEGKKMMVTQSRNLGALAHEEYHAQGVPRSREWCGTCGLGEP